MKRDDTGHRDGPAQSGVFARSTRAEADHAALKVATEQLRSFCITAAERMPSTGHLELLEVELRNFARLLFAHFDDEERDRYFDDVISQRPRLQGRIAELSAEHGAMRAQLDELRAAAQRGKDPYELNCEILAFLDRLARHESAENELIYETYWFDVGGTG